MPKSRVRKSRTKRTPARTRLTRSASWLDAGGFVLPKVSFPEDILGRTAPEHAEVRIDLVLASESEQESARLPLLLTRRLLSTDRFELWGRDAADVFAVHLSGTSGGQWSLRAGVIADSLDGHQMRDILGVLRALSTTGQVGLTVAGGQPSLWSPLPSPVLSPPLPPGLESLVEAHAFVEEVLGTRVPAPISYTAAEAQDTLETAALLRGETVVQSWHQMLWPLPTSEAEQVLQGIFREDGAARLELEKDWSWTVGASDTAVGTVTITYASTGVAAAEPDKNHAGTTVLTLRPAHDDTLTVRLVSVTPRTFPAEADQRWFWTAAWQARESEVDGHVAAGRVTVHDDAAAMFDHLSHLD